MLIHFLSFALAYLANTTQPANYYSNYTSAREAAKASQKEMLVFFTTKTCNTCESAWSAFTKDALATQQYISTRMDAENFDGSICFELFGLNEVPGWVILTPSSEVKEKWEGGWKDANGKPTAYDMTVSNVAIKEEKKNMPVTQPSASSSNTSTSNKKEPVANSAMNNSEKSNTPVAESKSMTSKVGFVLQAGYFGSEANAEKMVGDLKAKGFSYNIAPIQKDGATFYRVISKVFANESEANAEQQSLSASGIKASVKKM